MVVLEVPRGLRFTVERSSSCSDIHDFHCFGVRPCIASGRRGVESVETFCVRDLFGLRL